jgi:hypothetical protein
VLLYVHGQIVHPTGHRPGESVDRRFGAEQRLEIGACQGIHVKRAQALLQHEGTHEGLGHRDLLVKGEADQQSHRIACDEPVGVLGVREVQAVGHAPILAPGDGVAAAGVLCECG